MPQGKVSSPFFSSSNGFIAAAEQMAFTLCCISSSIAGTVVKHHQVVPRLPVGVAVLEFLSFSNESLHQNVASFIVNFLEFNCTVKI